MKPSDLPASATSHLNGRAGASALVVGELLALADRGRIAIVMHSPGVEQAALRAESVVDLHAAHVGREVLLGFVDGDARRPVVLGVLAPRGWPLEHPPGQVQVDADGERMIVSAEHQLVLRCGKSSLTLHSDGRVEIRGETVLTQAAGANRIRGGSVQLN
ncbi:DUF6484 domain-containing protein [Piscinibacter sp. XHJ-5]|uniref:DUF6484 domain-containing protein n=1 Tax=Piscinibacter sp. XHJ-5 TaxID=3037797 RepID=UPI0024530EB9|nr:DUF6484 domain-containing protein [Piscinibacter sp. XHJ-5]